MDKSTTDVPWIDKMLHFCKKLELEPLGSTNNLATRLNDFDTKDLIELMIEGAGIFLEIVTGESFED